MEQLPLSIHTERLGRGASVSAYQAGQATRPCGYRKIAALLRMEGWDVNHNKVERMWREEGLQLPQVIKSAEVFITRIALSYASGHYIKTTYGA